MNTHGHPFHKFLRITATKLPTLGHTRAAKSYVFVIISVSGGSGGPLISSTLKRKKSRKPGAPNTATTILKRTSKLKPSCRIHRFVFRLVGFALPRVLTLFRNVIIEGMPISGTGLNFRAKILKSYKTILFHVCSN